MDVEKESSRRDIITQRREQDKGKKSNIQTDKHTTFGRGKREQPERYKESKRWTRKEEDKTVEINSQADEEAEIQTKVEARQTE